MQFEGKLFFLSSVFAFHMQSSARHLSEQREVLLQKLTESDFTNQLLRSQLDEKEKLTLHSQVAHPPSFLPSSPPTHPPSFPPFLHL